MNVATTIFLFVKNDWARSDMIDRIVDIEKNFTFAGEKKLARHAALNDKLLDITSASSALFVCS